MKNPISLKDLAVEEIALNKKNLIATVEEIFNRASEKEALIKDFFKKLIEPLKQKEYLNEDGLINNESTVSGLMGADKKNLIPDIVLFLEKFPDVNEKLLGNCSDIKVKVEEIFKPIVESEYNIIAFTEDLVEKATLNNCLVSNSLKNRQMLASIARTRKDELKATVIDLINKIVESCKVDNKLAIDREFEDPLDKFEEIIHEINVGRMPSHRYPELFYGNYFCYQSEHSITNCKTFFTYALPKIKNLKNFIDNFKCSIGPTLFKTYINSPNLINFNQNTISVSAYELYSINYGAINAAERKALSKEQKEILAAESRTDEQNAVVVKINNVDTHTTSVNKSSAESHCSAFVNMVEKIKLAGVKVEYNRAIIKVNIIDSDNNLKGHIEKLNYGLKNRIDDLYAMDYSTLFESVLRFTHGVTTDLEKKYTDLMGSEKAQWDKKLNLFKLQLKAAQYYVYQMITEHQCTGGRYPYSTNVRKWFGLTIEEMVATLYWSTEDTENFKSKKTTTKLMALVVLIKSLQDARMGYSNDDIDMSGSEYGNYENINVIKAEHRCDNGAINSLVTLFSTIHDKYNIKVITIESINNELKNIFHAIVQNNLESINKLNKDDLIQWVIFNKTAKGIKDFCYEKFNEGYKINKGYRKDFEDNFKGYIPDVDFYRAIDSAASNISCSAQIYNTFRLDILPYKEVYKLIALGKLPIFHVNEKTGYQSYLNSLPEPYKSDLLWYCFSRIFNELQKGSEDQSIVNALAYLANNDLPAKYYELPLIEGKFGKLSLCDGFYNYECINLLVKGKIPTTPFDRLFNSPEILVKTIDAIQHKISLDQFIILLNHPQIAEHFGGFTKVFNSIKERLNPDEYFNLLQSLEIKNSLEAFKFILKAGEGKLSDNRYCQLLANPKIINNLEAFKLVLKAGEGKLSAWHYGQLLKSPEIINNFEAFKLVLKAGEGKLSAWHYGQLLKSPEIIKSQRAFKLVLKAGEGKLSAWHYGQLLKSPEIINNFEAFKFVLKAGEGKLSDGNYKTLLSTPEIINSLEAFAIVLKAGQDKLSDGNYKTLLSTPEIINSLEAFAMVLNAEKKEKLGGYEYLKLLPDQRITDNYARYKKYASISLIALSIGFVIYNPTIINNIFSLTTKYIPELICSVGNAINKINVYDVTTTAFNMVYDVASNGTEIIIDSMQDITNYIANSTASIIAR